MKCSRPITLFYNALGERISKTAFDLALGQDVYAKSVGCGKCIACRVNRRREWTLRLCHEEVFSDSAFFVTLTYDEDHIPFDVNGNMAVSVDDVQRFMKRLRKACPGYRIRYFLNSEYGPETGRPHYHALIFNIPEHLIFQGALRIKRGRSVSFTSPWLQSIWKNGNVEFGIASKERAGYCAKYFVDRKDIDPILRPNFSLMSRDPGIGHDYQEKIADKVKALGLHACLNSSGTYVGLPRYYSNKIFTQEERKVRFLDYLSEIPSDFEQFMYNNADIVEENRLRALTWKHKKSKI